MAEVGGWIGGGLGDIDCIVQTDVLIFRRENWRWDEWNGWHGTSAGFLLSFVFHKYSYFERCGITFFDLGSMALDFVSLDTCLNFGGSLGDILIVEYRCPHF